MELEILQNEEKRMNMIYVGKLPNGTTKESFILILMK